MFVRKFLAWASSAPAAERAPAAASLARALLNGELPKDEEYEAGVALAALADDPSPLVRRALAIEIAPRSDAPRQILIALAADQAEVAGPILALSPALGDADLIDAAIVGDDAIRLAIAGRLFCRPASAPRLWRSRRSIALSPSLITGAPMRPFRPFGARSSVSRRMRRCARRCWPAPIWSRPCAPASFRRGAEALQGFVVGCGWLSAERAGRVVRDSQRTHSSLSRQAREAAMRAPASQGACVNQGN